MYRKGYFLSIIFSLLFIGAAAQDSIPVRWNATATKTDSSHYQLKISAILNKGWHIYTASAQNELTGLSSKTKDVSLRLSAPQINTKTISIEDPIFGNKLDVYKDSLSFTQELTTEGKVPAEIKLNLYAETGSADNFLSDEQTISIPLEGGITDTTSNRILIPAINLNDPASDCGKGLGGGTTETKSKGLLSLFILGFLGGLVALLTPCVFPMIPLTVSFFTKKSQSRKSGIRNAFLYGFFIFIIYVLLSVPFHFLDSLNPEILNNISTNVYLNVFFFLVFIFFALSFFGYYEITLPGALSNTADSKASAGNIAGIFFMALTLALVSFSCTGPILGSLLAGSLSADGGAMQLTSGMAGFGLALALPFAFFALFPNWLNSLPKSGGWLTTVKVVLGFLELGLAFKFLSNADLVMHWGILKREIFIGIWILVGIGLTLYLFGKIRFKHDSPIKKLSKGRIFFGLMAAIFTLYLIPGVTNTRAANLSVISGFPPPLYYSIYKSGNDCVLDLNCTRDYNTGLKMAREQKKPILIDFTGYACVNCRRMEENVWSRDRVYRLMKDSFIVVSLYVDDKMELPASEQFTYITKDGQKKDIRTVGDKWSTFETENFQNNAQPLYAILNLEEKLLTTPVGYVPDEEDYFNWLLCGVEQFRKSTK